jgi:tryptophan synthase alpha chain
MNRINRLFQSKHSNILSIFFTAGFPSLDSTPSIIKALAEAGADMIEIGIPFSDPMADGPVIQSSNAIALRNGMKLRLLFDQLKDIRRYVDIPLLLMGYLNPVLQFGMERFCNECATTGIDGVILPDLPLEVYLGDDKNLINNQNLSDLFTHQNLHHIFLISPQTSKERIYKIDNISRSFIYMVSSSSTTGVKGSFSTDQIQYFERIKAMKLKNPALIGFGISNHIGFIKACEYAQGAIIGSAFVKMLTQTTNIMNDIRSFISGMKE